MINDFQQDYIEEAKQILKSLEHSLLELEKNATPDEINNVYRYLHTLKGSAGMFGYNQIERLAHELESIYSDVRDGVRQTDEFILDLTLHAVDVFADLIDGKDAAKETDKIIRTIQGLSESCKDENAKSEITGESESGKLECFAVLIKPEKEIFNRGINLSSILDEVQELGAHEFTIHNEIISFEKQLEKKEITSWFEILVATTSGLESLKDVFMFIKESEYSIIPVKNAETFSSEQYHQYV